MKWVAWASGSKESYSFTEKKGTSSRNRSKGEGLWPHSVLNMLEVPMRPPCEGTHNPTLLWSSVPDSFGSYQ
jgi:hypothetical protein